ncbi:MAG: hypothetical protein FWH03_05215 [Firmicutes bacterium]|nr:hypothetical protein [Bacillota bacterium]
MASKTKKKKNFFAEYFSNFGVRQICDLLMLVGAIVMFVGLFTLDVVTATGIGMLMVASLLAMYRALRVMLKKDINKRSPEYKNAWINLIIMSVILALTVLGMVAVFVW